jgi:hypothetical protein
VNFRGRVYLDAISARTTPVLRAQPSAANGYATTLAINDTQLSHGYYDVVLKGLGPSLAPANAAPVLPFQADRTIAELTPLVVTNSATDPGTPAALLTYRLLNAPGGAAVDGRGVITWTPEEAQGPGSNQITTVVTDNGTPPLSATNQFVVSVIEVNIPPVLADPGDLTVEAGSLLSFTAEAADTDLPAQPLTFSLAPEAPTGARITSDGHFTWTPALTQAPGTPLVTLIVSDGVTNDTRSLRIVVSSTTPPWARIDHAVVLEGGQCRLGFSGSSGAKYNLETSPDLLRWTTSYSGTLPDGGAEWTDPSTESARFYRIRLLPW